MRPIPDLRGRCFSFVIHAQKVSLKPDRLSAINGHIFCYVSEMQIMLALTRKTHYALIALVHLATDPDGRSSAREIAAAYGLPLPLLMNLLKQLTQEELVRSVRGPRGGYMLTLPPDKITLTRVVRAVEGPIHVSQCVPDKAVSPEEDDAADCVRMGRCPIRASLERVHDRMIAYLDSMTLAEVIGTHGEPCRNREPAVNDSGVPL